MKQTLLFIFFLFSYAIYGQSTGINYQSVILKPKEKSLPGVEISSLPLVNTSICMRFTISDNSGSIEYQEIVSAKTDDFGIVNTIIGFGTKVGGYSTNFSSIVWSALNKKLVVELDITNTCSSFEEISNQSFSFSPYAIHALSANTVSGIVEISKGGTGASTITGAKTNLGLNNVDNTSDLNKPISIAVQSGLDSKENSFNKISDISLDPLSIIKYPSVRAVKEYVDSKVVAATPDATAVSTGKIRLAGDLSGDAANPTVPGLVLKEDVINKSLNVTIDGGSDIKFPSVKATKTYVDNAIANATIVDANSTTKGKIQLSGDLSGTADAPVVPGLVLKEDVLNKSLNVTIDGGSDIKFPSVKATKTYVDNAIANATIVDANSTTKGKIQLSGDLTGTAEAPIVKDGAITDAKIATGISASKVGLGNVDNTSDVDKPISTATQTALNLKQDISNLSTSLTTDASSVIKYPAVKTVKDYIDAQVTPDATTAIKGRIQLSGDLTGTADAPAVKDSAVLERTLVGFTSATGTISNTDTVLSAINKLDGNVAVDATTAIKGRIQLSGDLSGTAVSPTVPGLALKEDVLNKSLNVNIDGGSDSKYPSVRAVKTYIDNAIVEVATGSIADADSDTKGKIQLSGDLTGTADEPLVNDATLGTKGKLQLAGDLTGTATAPLVKDATIAQKGKIRLAGDLTGTADTPLINPGVGGIYRGNGSLIANTTVSMNLNTLSFKDGNITIGTNATVPYRHTIDTGSNSTIWFPGNTAIKTNNNAFDTSIGFISNMAFNSGSWILAQDSKPGWMLNVSSSEDRFTIRRISQFGFNLEELLSLEPIGDLRIKGAGISTMGWNTFSDRRLKNTIHDTRYSINDVLKIKVRDYYLNSSPTILSNGFIAQELFEVYPDAVFKGTDELDAQGNPKQIWSVDYGKLTPLLTKAIQEQQHQINEQQQQIEELKSQIQTILALIKK